MEGASLRCSQDSGWVDRMLISRRVSSGVSMSLPVLEMASGRPRMSPAPASLNSRPVNNDLQARRAGETVNLLLYIVAGMPMFLYGIKHDK